MILWCKILATNEWWMERTVEELHLIEKGEYDFSAFNFTEV